MHIFLSAFTKRSSGDELHFQFVRHKPNILNDLKNQAEIYHRAELNSIETTINKLLNSNKSLRNIVHHRSSENQ